MVQKEADEYRFWNQTWERRVGEFGGENEREGGKSYLDAACSHAKLSSKIIAEGRVWFCVYAKDGL